MQVMQQAQQPSLPSQSRSESQTFRNAQASARLNA